MNKLIRLYNQNRALVFAVIAVIALIIIILQVLNSLVKTNNEAKKANIANDRNSSTNVGSTTISPSNISVITGEKVNTNEEDKEIIKEFVDYCNKKDIQRAYAMLSEECKERIYPTIEKFKSGYVDRIFKIDRMYTLENWHVSSSLNTYYVRYIEDILASGNANSSNNMSDYITTQRTNNAIYLNINSFVGSEDINKSVTKNRSYNRNKQNIYVYGLYYCKS